MCLKPANNNTSIINYTMVETVCSWKRAKAAGQDYATHLFLDWLELNAMKATDQHLLCTTLGCLIIDPII